MEDVLSVYSRKYDEKFPVICMDEKPVQLLMDARKGFKSKKSGVECYDNEYIRNGTASIFMFTEPLQGWRWTDARERRTRVDWAHEIRYVLEKCYPNAEKVVLVMYPLTGWTTGFLLYNILNFIFFHYISSQEASKTIFDTIIAFFG